MLILLLQSLYVQYNIQSVTIYLFVVCGFFLPQILNPKHIPSLSFLSLFLPLSFLKFISLFFISISLYFTLFLHSSTARSFLVIIQKTKFENARIYRLKNIWLWICLVLSSNVFVIDQDHMLLQWLVLNVFDLYDYFVC